MYNVNPNNLEQGNPIDRFNGATRRPNGSPNGIFMPDPIPSIPAQLPPIESPVVGHIRLTSGSPEVGARGRDGATTSLQKNVRLSNLAGQGGVFFFGRTRTTRAGSQGTPFITGIRFNMYDDGGAINRGILQATDIGRVATISLIIPYTGEGRRQNPEATTASTEYAVELEENLLTVFPHAKFTKTRLYPYDPAIRSTALSRASTGIRASSFVGGSSGIRGPPGVLVYSFEATRQGTISFDHRYVRMQDVPPFRSLRRTGFWAGLKACIGLAAGQNTLGVARGRNAMPEDSMPRGQREGAARYQDDGGVYQPGTAQVQAPPGAVSAAQVPAPAAPPYGGG